ncbi:MAG: AMIN domain-containing protein [Desulfatirhabdiaceae bacterium]
MFNAKRIQLMKRPIHMGRHILVVSIILLMVATSIGDCSQKQSGAEQAEESTGSSILRYKIDYPALPPADTPKPLESDPVVGPSAATDGPLPGTSQPTLDETPSIDQNVSEKNRLLNENQSVSVEKPLTETGQDQGKKDLPEPSTKDTSKTDTGKVKKIINIHVKTGLNQSESVMIVLTGFHPPEISTVDNGIPRIICDFHDVRLRPGINRLIEINGKFIQRIRIGIHKEPARKTRVVLDLVPSRDYEVEQLFYQKDNTYSLKIQLRS